MEGVEKILRYYRLSNAMDAVKKRALVVAYKENLVARKRASQSMCSSVKLEPQDFLTSATQEILDVNRRVASPQPQQVERNPFQLSSYGGKSSLGEVESSICKLEAQSHHSDPLPLDDVIQATATLPKFEPKPQIDMETLMPPAENYEGYNLNKPKLLYQSVHQSEIDNRSSIFSETPRTKFIKVLDGTESIERQNDVVDKFLNKPMRSTTAEQSEDVQPESSAEVQEAVQKALTEASQPLLNQIVPEKPRASEDSSEPEMSWSNSSDSEYRDRRRLRAAPVNNGELEKRIKLNEALQSIQQNLQNLPVRSTSSIVEEIPVPKLEIPKKSPSLIVKIDGNLRPSASPKAQLRREVVEPQQTKIVPEADEIVEDKSDAESSGSEEDDIENPTTSEGGNDDQDASSEVYKPHASPKLNTPTRAALPAAEPHRVRIKSSSKKKKKSKGSKPSVGVSSKRHLMPVALNPKRKVHHPYSDIQQGYLRGVLKAAPPEGFPDWSAFETKVNLDFHDNTKIGGVNPLNKGREPGRPKGRKSDKGKSFGGFDGEGSGWGGDSSWVTSLSSQQKESVEISDSSNHNSHVQFAAYGDSSGESHDVRLPMQYAPPFDAFGYGGYQRPPPMLTPGIMPLPKPRNRF